MKRIALILVLAALSLYGAQAKKDSSKSLYELYLQSQKKDGEKDSKDEKKDDPDKKDESDGKDEKVKKADKKDSKKEGEKDRKVDDGKNKVKKEAGTEKKKPAEKAGKKGEETRPAEKSSGKTQEEKEPQRAAAEKNGAVSQPVEKAPEEKKPQPEETVPSVYYTYTLTPSSCTPLFRGDSVRVVPVTDVFFKLNERRGVWVPVGEAMGIRNGMQMTVCRDVGNSHLYPVSVVEVEYVWDDGLYARPLRKFNPDMNPGSGIRMGDFVVFNEKVTAVSLVEKKKVKRKPAPGRRALLQ